MLAWRCRWAKEEKHGARNSCPTLRASNPSTSCLLLQCTILPSMTFSTTNLPHHLCSQLDPHLWFQSSLTHQALSPLTIYSKISSTLQPHTSPEDNTHTHLAYPPHKSKSNKLFKNLTLLSLPLSHSKILSLSLSLSLFLSLSRISLFAAQKLKTIPTQFSTSRQLLHYFLHIKSKADFVDIHIPTTGKNESPQQTPKLQTLHLLRLSISKNSNIIITNSNYFNQNFSNSTTCVSY